MKHNSSITATQVAKWLHQHHQLSGDLTPLVGDVDLNFKCQTNTQTFTVKISCVHSLADFEFESALLLHTAKNQSTSLSLPQPKLNQQGEWLTVCEQQPDQFVVMRVLTWVAGHLWSRFLPQSSDLRQHLGKQAGLLDHTLASLKHPLATRNFNWDLAQALWIKDQLKLFNENQQTVLTHFIQLFEANQTDYKALRKQVIHNDLNDNNILVNDHAVSGFIDFGDAIKTQLINELAITCAYALMHQPDPLSAAADVVHGYHQVHALEDAELQLLYPLIGMRLAVSVTQSALAKTQQPNNSYKSVSEQAAWDVLNKWQDVPSHLAYYTFRWASDMSPHPQQLVLNNYLNSASRPLSVMFPEHPEKTSIYAVDLSVASPLLGAAGEYENHAAQMFKLAQAQLQTPQQFLAGGYCEARSFYASDAFSFEGNSGKEYRTMHLGLDVWLPAQTAIHTPLAGRVVGLHDNDYKRDYGPTVILSHKYPEGTFFTLYGHLSRKTLAHLKVGDELIAGQLLAWVGEPHENGGWSPHLHFQIMHDLLGRTHDFPGACRPIELPVFKSLCPDPSTLFNNPAEMTDTQINNQTLIDYRHQHLGKSLSLSYSEPIQMLRGDDVYLIDQWGQKYLDTCNNVAHVGHENPAVVSAGQGQMAVLNTNSRYLHPAIVQFTQSLLDTLPDELSVVHMVNSGSEANELALRMAKAYSGGEDVIALESGYHGNSNACIEISSYKFDGKGGQGAPEKTHIVPLPDRFRGLHRGADTGKKYASYVQQSLETLQASDKQIAAFIAESIVSCGGQIELPEGYLQLAYQAVRAAGGVCIADEVQVGCGRIGSHFWAFEPHGVVPDILTIGKPIGNGHPLAVVVCTREVADRFANGMEYFNTFGGNPVSATIGQAVLQEIKSQSLQENASVTGEYLKQSLRKLMTQHPIIKDVRGQGLFLGFELCDDTLKPLPKQAQYLADRMRDLGILISTDGPDHNVIKIKPPITFNQTHADELLTRLSTILHENPMQIN